MHKIKQPELYNVGIKRFDEHTLAEDKQYGEYALKYA
jgi:hypothetical protein